MNILTYAAIDIGSNAVRLLINSIYKTNNTVSFNKISLIRVPIRLGEDVFNSGNISSNNISRLSDAMKAFSLLMKIHNVTEFKAFATSAMREAKNKKEVIKKIKKESEIEIEIISGNTEAKIIFNTQLIDFLNSEKHYLYVDVGGGSTEISLLNKGKVLASCSFEIGTVRMLSGKITNKSLENEIKPWVRKITEGLNVELVGSGGNINYIFKMSKRKEGSFLSSLYLHKQFELFKNMSYEDRIEKYGMKPDRADVIVPAINIYYSIMIWAHARKLHVPKIGAADGMIAMMYKKNGT